MTPEWAQRRAVVDEILQRYPERRSAIMPLLHLAQESRGYVAREDIEAIAEILAMTPAQVESVASFYALYVRRPRGRHTLTVCSNLACVLGGARSLVEHLRQRLGVEPGETTDDGLFTLQVTGECLAACDQAPVLQVDGYYVHRASPDKVDRLLEALRRGVPMAELADRAALPHEAEGGAQGGARPETPAGPGKGARADGWRL
ncbi:NADH-quinone oxidoreductase subunit NuoE family protein [Geochorda subterranea]|uniref:NAD(P)H-dependent oxidoreductase subunit E n=1 Tax=Geochorda subterranea TaxID=3109564 RepID=A0ABZ1BM35_9FIRM|nr:NAD(P)H-dependent oxidoreductase subunit E [Limnochorda sp. LNt]WRP13611.1 NAD(P)H-dependent oxidoreductase subunit E [Limnochorda sp. LNt]